MTDLGPEGRTPTLEVFGDYVCPFCWLAEPLLASVCADLQIAPVRRAFELRPLPAPYPDERYVRRLWERGALPIARSLGLDAAFPTIRTRTRKAHEAAAFAREHGAGEVMHAALFRAHFLEGRDIGRVDVLVELGVQAGLDGHSLRVALDVDRYADAMTEDRERATALGITGLPAFVLCVEDRTVVREGWCAAAELRDWIEENLETVRG